ncbi:MAG: hypothetical protein AAF658_04225 [Myxococcota bacterium]
MLNGLRLATPADNDALIDLFGQVPMQGDLVLSTLRGPNFFHLYAMQDARFETWVYAPEGEVVLAGTMLARNGWLDGRPVRVGYLGDLRARYGSLRARKLPVIYAQLFRHAREHLGCDLFLTSIMSSNTLALNSLARRSPSRQSQPHYAAFRKFDAVSVQFTGRKKVANRRYSVRRATDADLPSMVALLDTDHRRRACGYRFDLGELESRIAQWPGWRVRDTFLAFNRDVLVGLTTAWDPRFVKRYRVDAYRGSMAWSKFGFNAAARVFGWNSLPEPGEEFRYFYLTNTSIRGDDPEVFAALLVEVYGAMRPHGYHFFSFPLFADDPLAPAVDGFATRRLGFELFVVSDAADPVEHFSADRCGFEMALA